MYSTKVCRLSYSGEVNLGNVSCKGQFGMCSLIQTFPVSFVRPLSNKARRNCSNIGVAQIVAASWSSNNNNQPFVSAVGKDVDDICNNDSFQKFDNSSFLNGDGSIAIHAGN